MTFSDMLWNSVQDIYRKITNHPYICELAIGTLDIQKFKYYLRQDSIYLVNYSKALALAAAKSDNVNDMFSLLSFAKEGVEIEMALHKEFFKFYGIRPALKPSPSCEAYCNYLISSAASNSYGEALATILPCFKVYMEVGNFILENSSTDNPYSKWIDTYSGDEFAKATNLMSAITDRAAKSASEPRKKKMKKAYILSTRYELMFWDGAYNLEEW